MVPLTAEHIETEWEDSDGYWVALRAGWCSAEDPQCHQIHEDTKQEAYRVQVEPCLCESCKAERGN